MVSMAAASSSIELSGNTFQDNSAGWQGGAVAVYAESTTLMSVRLTSNNSFAHNQALRGGGALFVYASNATWATIDIGGSASFRSNSAARSGGAVAVWLYDATQSNLTVTGANFDGNVATNTNSSVIVAGGGLAVLGYTAVEVAVRIDGGGLYRGNNALHYGGGCYIGLTNSTASWASITDTNFSSNNASYGGGAQIDVDGTAVEARVYVGGLATFDANTAATGGGGLLVLTSNSKQGRVEVGGGAAFRLNKARYGGGVSVEGSNSTAVSVVLSGTVLFQGNRADNSSGGGRSALQRNLLAAANDLVTRLPTDVGGGGMKGFGPNNAASEGDQVAGQGGGCMVIFKGANAPLLEVLGSVEFNQNTATGSAGGGLCVKVSNSISPTLTIGGAAKFLGNVATVEGEGTTAGGGLFVKVTNTSAAKVTIWNSTKFWGNVATVGGGADLMLSESVGARVLIAGAASFQNNSASNFGGGFYVDLSKSKNANLTISGSVACVANAAGRYGGGYLLFVQQMQQSVVQMLGNGTVVRDNRAVMGGGGSAVDISGSDNNTAFVVAGGAWERNSADMRAGGILMYANISSVTVRFQGGRFVNNTAALGAGGALVVVLGPPTNTADFAQVMVDGVDFSGNYVKEGVGGAMYLEGTSSVPDWCQQGAYDVEKFSCPVSFDVAGCTFERNNASYGGAIYIINSQASVSESKFAVNSANWSGGALYTKRMQAVSIGLGVEFQDNWCVRVPTRLASLLTRLRMHTPVVSIDTNL
jgi:predicted outer membrane repeat protein